MPTKLDRYVLSEVIAPFLGGILFFTFIFLMAQILRLTEFFIVHGVPGGTLLKMTLSLGITFLPTALPIAFLISVLIGFGRLSSDSELVAMKASGIGLMRMTMPIFLFAIVVVALSIGLNLQWAPWAQRSFKGTLLKVSNTKVVSSIKEGTFTSGFFDLLIFADKVDIKTNKLSRVFIYDEREAKNPMTVVANTGEIVPVKAETDLGSAAMLKLYNGAIHRNNADENSYHKTDFDEYKLYLKIDEGADTSVSKPEMLSVGTLKQKIASTDANSWDGRDFRAEYARRIAVAFMPLVFVFLGIGFGTVRMRAVRTGAALVTLVTLLIYWGIQIRAHMAMQAGQMSPAFAMMLPDWVILAGGLFSFRRAMW